MQNKLDAIKRLSRQVAKACRAYMKAKGRMHRRKFNAYIAKRDELREMFDKLLADCDNGKAAGLKDLKNHRKIFGKW